MGDLHYGAAKGKRRMLAENLQRMGISETHHAENIRLYFRNHYQDQLFPLIFPKFNKENIADYVSFQGLNHLDKALEKRRVLCWCMVISARFISPWCPLLCWDIR